jgi:hypothetical protein
MSTVVPALVNARPPEWVISVVVLPPVIGKVAVSGVPPKVEGAIGVIANPRPTRALTVEVFRSTEVVPP